MSPPEPGTARYAELVRKALGAKAGHNWIYGDAALEIAPMGEDGVNTGSEARLRQFAKDSEAAIQSILVYRRVAEAWPPSTRVLGASWTAHRVLMAPEHRPFIRDGMTSGEAEHAVGQEMAIAAEAVARARGLTIASAQRLRKPEVREVRDKARELAAEHGTTVADEVLGVALGIVAAEQQAAAERQGELEQQAAEREAAKQQAAEQRAERKQAEYGRACEQHINGLTVLLAAEASGEWSPSGMHQALLYFMGQKLLDRQMPEGDFAEAIEAVENYANQAGS